MPDQLQLRGGTTAQHASFTGASKEVTVDTTKKTAVVHDGATAGGNPLMREDGSNSALAQGSASAPSLKFSGDTNTGLYSPGADQVAISTNGTGRLFVAANGTVTTSQSIAPTGGLAAWNAGLNLFSPGGGVGQIAASADTSGTAGTLVFQTGTERMRLDSSGRLGLGTSSPQGPIEIQGSQFAYFRNNCAGQTPAGSIGTGMVALGTNVQSSDGGAALVYGIPYGASGFDIASWDGSTYTRRFRIDNSGRVGIGTQTPAASLGFGTSVDSTPSSVSKIHLYNDGGNTVYGFGVSANQLNYRTGLATDAHVWFAGTTERFRCDGSGRLLVGTSSARGNFFNTTNQEALLQVESASQNTLFSSVYNSNNAAPVNIVLGKTRGGTNGSNTVVADGDGIGRVSFQAADGSDFVEAASIIAVVDGTPGANDMPGRIVFSTTADGASSPTERMRINSAGLITAGSGGVNGMKALLLNSGQIDTSGGLLTLRTVNDNSGGYYQVFQNSTATVIGTITQSGSTAVAYNTTSDYRLKENVVPLTGAIDRISQLQVHRFNFIADPDKTVDGFIAHEAQAVVPECVTGTKDEVDEDGNPVYQGIDQSKLVPLLTAALQEAIAKIETLEAKVAALEAA